ncbi:CbtB domain-containing protein [Acuticoccus yangtzensis]|uniref:CbtB domain-containing protein n=1 Tax=Acuticoccus yangtzensis TaxID=1443441 RepID=UPI0009499C00|nr:CbtB-domain containing protein [Acuticoccus yangtzensis]
MATLSAPSTSNAVGTGARAIALVTLCAGLALVFAVGFAHSSTLHNAGHDTRHALAFPCH